VEMWLARQQLSTFNFQLSTESWMQKELPVRKCAGGFFEIFKSLNFEIRNWPSSVHNPVLYHKKIVSSPEIFKSLNF
jgi:hypothetical protein